MTLKKNCKSKSCLDQKLCLLLFFHRDFGANFLCNSLLHRNKRLLISGQVFRQSCLKLVQNEEDYSLTLKF